MTPPTGSSTAPVIAHVVLSLELGGAEVLVTRMALALHDAGVRTVVLCLDTEGSLADHLRRRGIPVTLLGRRPGVLDVGCVVRLRRALRDAGATVVHTHDADAFAYGTLAARLAGALRVVHTQHGLPVPFGWKQRGKLVALRPGCHRFVGVSQQVTEIGLAARWFAPDRTLTIPNGVDVEAFRADPATRARVRGHLQVTDADVVVVSVARLAAIKDHPTLVRGFAMSPLAHEGHLWLVGDGPERGVVEDEVERAGLGTRIRMLGNRDDVRDLLAAADVFAMTSISEGISVSLLEAMAAGLVPVVTAVGGNVQVVTDAGARPNGLLVSPGRPGEVAEAFRRLAADPALRTRLGSSARETVRDRFSAKAMMDRYVAVYRRLATDRPRRQPAELA